ncbi:putative ABC transport system substrate-binding protein [Anaerotaenia torta]|uniref:ABC transporter substrate-binding protein n=1 Tax=Anaerotaenia torta TaxID=433293 RepID=UPI003D217870
MKKIVALMLAFVLVLSLAACGTPDTKTPGSGKPAGDQESKEDDGQKDEKTVYNVGILQLVQHEALDAATKGFRDALTGKLGNQIIFDEQNAAGDSPTCATIANQFVSSKYDLIMANATAALQASVSATNTIPILGTSVTDYATALDIDNWTGVTGMNVSGTADLAPLDKQAEMIKELFPDVKKIGILYCSGEPNSKYQSVTIQGYLKEMGYTCTEYTFADSNDVASVTQNACSNSDIIFIPTDNTAASCAEAINNVAEPAGVPIVTGEEGICRGCGVATLSIDYYELGYATGEMAYEILVNDADAAAMEVQYSPSTTYKYMADRAAKLGVTIPDSYTPIEVK